MSLLKTSCDWFDDCDRYLPDTIDVGDGGGRQPRSTGCECWVQFLDQFLLSMVAKIQASSKLMIYYQSSSSLTDFGKIKNSTL